MIEHDDTRLILDWLNQHQIDLVHIQSLEGFSLALIAVVRQTGRAVVVTSHDYWYVCPQVNLLYQNVHICVDYQGGQRCSTYLPQTPHRETRLKLLFAQNVESVIGSSTFRLFRQWYRFLLRRSTNDLRRDQPTSPPAIDLELVKGFTVADPDRHDGLIRYNDAPKPIEPCYEAIAADQNE